MGGGDDLIPQEECWELLASASVGRVALSIHALPAILPVQYYLDGRKLAVCLGHRELPERSLNAVVAFAADAIDPIGRSGWSVQVQGRSLVPGPFELTPPVAGRPPGRSCRLSRRRSAATASTCARSLIHSWHGTV